MVCQIIIGSELLYDYWQQKKKWCLEWQTKFVAFPGSLCINSSLYQKIILERKCSASPFSICGNNVSNLSRLLRVHEKYISCCIAEWKQTVVKIYQQISINLQNIFSTGAPGYLSCQQLFCSFSSTARDIQSAVFPRLPLCVYSHFCMAVKCCPCLPCSL